MRISRSITGFNLLLLSAVVLAGTAATAAPRDAASGMASGRVSVQDLSFTKRSDAVVRCPNGAALAKPDGSFACSSSPSSSSSTDMAINEKGPSGNNATVKTPK